MWGDLVGNTIRASAMFPENFPRPRHCLRDMHVCRNDLPENIKTSMQTILNDLHLVVAPPGEKQMLGKVFLIASEHVRIITWAISFQISPFIAEFIEHDAPADGVPLPWILHMPFDEQGEVPIRRECDLALQLARLDESLSYTRCVCSAPVSSMEFDKYTIVELVPLDLEKMREQFRANRESRAAMRALRLATDPVRRRSSGTNVRGRGGRGGRGAGRGRAGAKGRGRGAQGGRGAGRGRGGAAAAAAATGAETAESEGEAMCYRYFFGFACPALIFGLCFISKAVRRLWERELARILGESKFICGGTEPLC